MLHSVSNCISREYPNPHATSPWQEYNNRQSLLAQQVQDSDDEEEEQQEAEAQMHNLS